MLFKDELFVLIKRCIKFAVLRCVVNDDDAKREREFLLLFLPKNVLSFAVDFFGSLLLYEINSFIIPHDYSFAYLIAYVYKRMCCAESFFFHCCMPLLFSVWKWPVIANFTSFRHNFGKYSLKHRSSDVKTSRRL